MICFSPQKMLTKTCAVAGCDRTSELPEMSFFSFPKNKTVFYQWIRFISEPITHDLANKYICSAHFPDEDFFDDNREHLRDNAVPSLFDEETISLMKENHCSLNNDIEVYKDDIQDNYIKEEDVQYIKEEEVEFVEDSILEIEIEADTSSCDECNSNNIESSDVVSDPTKKNIHNEHDFQNTIVEIDGSGLIDENTIVEIVTDDAINKTILTKQNQIFSKKNIKEPDSNKEIIRLSSCQDSTTCDLCRLCTKQIEDDKIHIFSQDETSVQLIEMVKVIMPGKVNENDGLPNSICMPCLHKLKECYDLTMMFLTADAYFRNKEFITLPRPIEQKGNHYQKNPEEQLNENATFEKNNSNHVLFIKNPEDLKKDMALNHNLTSINENSSNNTSENESNSNTLVTSSSDKHLCSSCHDTFNSSVELTLHKYTMHKSAKANGLYNCPICPLVFSMLQALKLHVQQRHSKICKLYKCGDCKVVFRTQQLLDNHKKKIHKKI
uniref:THAP-type domain-containing protein n=3 Tax=Clastoptera arizonana TaxID=38151 RepID=A0A1B6D8L4_9HEMI